MEIIRHTESRECENEFRLAVKNEQGLKRVNF